MWAQLAAKTANAPMPLVAPPKKSTPVEAPLVTPTTATTPTAPSATCASAPQDGPTPVTHVVLDSGAFIAADSWSALTKLGTNARLFTIEQVLEEIKDEQSRQRLATFPHKIEVRTVADASIKAVTEFARKTGDLSALSRTDLLILSLTHQIEREVNGETKFLRTEPKKLPSSKEFAEQQKTAEMEEKTAQQSEQSTSDESAALSADAGTSSESSIATASTDAASSASTPAPTVSAASSSTSSSPAVPSASTPASTPDDVGEGAWITPSNLHLHTSGVISGFGGTRRNRVFVEESAVGLITTDYAMQNVCLQMGLRVLSINGYSIRSVRHWILKCHSCLALCRDTTKAFCPECGNHTMIKVAVTVNGKGVVRYWHGQRHMNTRGTKYSIPLPRGGRDGAASNLKLSEDTFNTFKHQQYRQRQNGDVYSEANEFAFRNTGKEGKKDVYGYGRKNPNVPKKTGNKKKSNI